LYEAERRRVQAIIHACGSPLTSYFLNLYHHFTDQLMGINNSTGYGFLSVQQKHLGISIPPRREKHRVFFEACVLASSMD
jgi:hypothetical protein